MILRIAWYTRILLLPTVSHAIIRFNKNSVHKSGKFYEKIYVYILLVYKKSAIFSYLWIEFLLKY